MNKQQQLNFDRIAKAIGYIHENYKAQPSLEEIAKSVHLSPFHFQRLFTDWAGVSPKKFLQYISIEHAKHVLDKQQTSLFDAAFETGLSGTGRLHDLFIKIEGMTPGEYKAGGRALQINYHYYDSPFGQVLAASTTKGICYMGFASDPEVALTELHRRFPNARYINASDSLQERALSVFLDTGADTDQIKLHLKGTDFQLKIWEALLKIPSGDFSTYGKIARQIDSPNASRAVGTAIGNNPVAYLIPCHRVIRSSGAIGGYMWGTDRKLAIIGWEAAKQNVLT